MTTRAVIYARFSTDHQDERSIEDQVALCRDYVAKEGLHVVEVFEDRARSGASILNRDGLLALMDGAKINAFDVVVVEALDRLSRDMEDLAGIHKRLTHWGIEIRAVHEGKVNTVLVAYAGSSANSTGKTQPTRCDAVNPAASAPALRAVGSPTATKRFPANPESA
jgi:site-specific DNA recombinase